MPLKKARLMIRWNEMFTRLRVLGVSEKMMAGNRGDIVRFSARFNKFIEIIVAENFVTSQHDLCHRREDLGFIRDAIRVKSFRLVGFRH